MFDPDLIQELDPEIRESVKQAILILHNSGVLHAQKERLFSRVLQGSDTESVEDVTKKVLRYRLEIHGLEALIQLGESVKEEQDSEE